MSEKALIVQAERFFTNDFYKTPAKVKRHPRDILTFGSRWSFYLIYFSVVWRLWLRARKGFMAYEDYARISLEILKGVETHRGTVEIEGLDKILASDQNFVIIGNHISSLEAQTLAAILNTRKVAFVMKESLLTTPFFGPIMRNANPIPVGRKNPMDDLKSVMETGSEYLKKGYSVIIFPQGTRSSLFDPAHFNKLGVRLALRAGVPCLPLALKTDFWGNGKVLKTFGPTHPEKTVHFAFGDPILPKGKGKDAHEGVVSFISEKLKLWGFPVKED
ncbi:MAG: lysophospholipid acyltransferase family protein [Spirochaetales bacterium]|nr:lysophospholipid acyltransferase family protein [Spirochaetales bacterium]